MKTIFTRSATVIALAGAAILATGAAQASPDPRAAKPQTDAVSSGSAVAEPSMQQKYCVADTITGSRVAKKVCKTRADWISDGWDPAKDK